MWSTRLGFWKSMMWRRMDTCVCNTHSRLRRLSRVMLSYIFLSRDLLGSRVLNKLDGLMLLLWWPLSHTTVRPCSNISVSLLWWPMLLFFGIIASLLQSLLLYTNEHMYNSLIYEIGSYILWNGNISFNKLFEIFLLLLNLWCFWNIR